MPRKEDVQEIMASGDLQHKADLLSKAVISITKQKQQLEEEHLRLIAEVARSQEEVAAVRDENATLRQQLKAEAEKNAAAGGVEGGAAPAGAAGGAAFSQQVLKGLSSIVGGTATAASAAGAGLKPEDVEHLIHNNESVHRQLFDLKAKHDRSVASLKKQVVQHQEEERKLQEQLSDLRSVVDTVTATCDRLNALATQQKAMLHVYHTHFRLALPQGAVALAAGAAPAGTTTPFSLVLRHAPKSSSRHSAVSTEVPEERRALVDAFLAGTRDHVHKLFGGVSVWVATLRRHLPTASSSRAAAARRGGGSIPPGCLRSTLDALEDLHELHLARKGKATELWDRLRALLEVDTAASTDGRGARESSAAPHRKQQTGRAGSGSRSTAEAQQGRSSLATAEDTFRSSSSSSSDRGEVGADGTPASHRPGAARERRAIEVSGEVLLELLDTVADWLELVRLHLPLLVSSSEYLDGGVGGQSPATAAQPRSGGSTPPPCAGRSPARGTPAATPATPLLSLPPSTAAVPAGPPAGARLLQSGAESLALLEGVLRSMRQLLQQLLLQETTGAVPGWSRGVPPDTLVAVSLLLWHATYEMRPLAAPLHDTALALSDLAACCDSSHLRNVYHLLQAEAGRLLDQLLQEQGRSTVAALNREDDALRTLIPAPGPPRPAASPGAEQAVTRSTECLSPSPSRAGYRDMADTIHELLSLLEAADETAMQQHHQQRCAAVEIACMREELIAQAAEVARLHNELSECQRTHDLEKEVLQEQVELLSNQLTATTAGLRTPFEWGVILCINRMEEEEGGWPWFKAGPLSFLSLSLSLSIFYLLSILCTPSVSLFVFLSFLFILYWPPRIIFIHQELKPPHLHIPLPAMMLSVSDVKVRMENAFIPVAYHVTIAVDLENWTYEAEERITLARNPEVPQRSIIQLHAAGTMKIESVTGGSLVKQNCPKEVVYIQLPSDVASNDSAKPELVIRFKHQIQEELRGFYRVKYRYKGTEYRMASTHFEPTAARLFFICQDEPAMRADVTLTVKIPTSYPQSDQYTVLTNTPLRNKAVEGEYIVHSFDSIPRCPPYLVACVIGQLECISTTAGQSKIPVSLYATKGKLDRANFALETSAFALDFFEEFFQHPFPLPKLDVVAVPDFPIGGMENWGCICCVESILVDDSTSIEGKKRASELLCHEVSHNWFGNLVAIDWWEGLWLKEGFASWCGNYASHIRHPSWNCLDDAMRSVAGAKEVDQYDHSHPVEVPIIDPGDITQIFDRISYDKGMGLVFMLQAFLGEGKWGPAVAHYIRRYAYGATKTHQLWEAIEESSGEPIADVMKSFTSQMGYPVVHVERTSPDRITLRQQPCRLVTTAQKPKETQVWRQKENKEGNEQEQHEQPEQPNAEAQLDGVAVEEVAPAAVEEEGDAAAGEPEMELVTEYEDTLWSIPVVLEGPEGKTVNVVLNGKEPVEVEASETDFPFLVANPRRTGFFRCRYDNAMFQRLLNNYTALQIADRCALLSDVKAATYMGLADLDRLGQLAAVVRQHETETLVLKEFAATIFSFSSAFTEGEMVGTLRLAQLSFFIPMAMESITPEARAAAKASAELEIRQNFILETALLLLTRHYSISAARKEPLIRWAFDQAKAMLENKGAPFETSTLGLCLAAYNRLEPSTTAETRQGELLQALKRVDGNDELSRAVIVGLCASPEPTYVEDVLRHCMMNTAVRSLFGGIAFAAAAANSDLKTGQLWQFFQIHFNKIKEQWGGGQFRIQVIVECVASSLSGQSAADEFERFFRLNPLPNARLAVGRATENIRLRAWLRQHWSPEALLHAFDPHDL
eukprot:gene2304-1441_t